MVVSSLMLLVACTATDADPVSTPVPPVGTNEPAPPPDEPYQPPPQADPLVTEGELIGDEGIADWLFDDTVLHRVDVTLPIEASSALNEEPYEYVLADVEIDGIPVTDVGVRMRGKLGSFRELDDKPKLGIDFNKFSPGREFYGLERINLNNNVSDCTFAHEAYAYMLYQEMGVEVPRVAFTEVYLNGELKGLYTVQEHPDDSWLKERYAPGDGNLYDGKYTYDGSFWSIESIDFIKSLQHNFQLEEGTNVDGADIKAVTEAVDDIDDGVGTFEDLDVLVDMDQFHTAFAVEQWIGQWDGYALNQNNYRVYFDSSDGRMRFVPTDLDLAFDDGSFFGDWTRPSGRMVELCFDDLQCQLDHQVAMQEVLDHFATLDLLGTLETWSALLAGAADEDPFMSCSSLDREMGELVEWSEDRESDMEDFWQL